MNLRLLFPFLAVQRFYYTLSKDNVIRATGALINCPCLSCESFSIIGVVSNKQQEKQCAENKLHFKDKTTAQSENNTIKELKKEDCKKGL